MRRQLVTGLLMTLSMFVPIVMATTAFAQNALRVKPTCSR